jgi:hypothetical protein
LAFGVLGFGVRRRAVALPRDRRGTFKEGRRTFQKEYLAFPKKHGAPFDERYLWDWLHPVILIPYPTGRFFPGTLSQALRAWLRSGLSLRDTLQTFRNSI